MYEVKGLNHFTLTVFAMYQFPLTHWGRVTPICASKLTIIGPDNSLPPGRRQAIIWTNAGILLIRTSIGILSEIDTNSIQENAFKNVVCKMAAILLHKQIASACL